MTGSCKLEPGRLKKLCQVDPRLMSYNIEMTEVTGGTFWKPYTPAQIMGQEPFTVTDTFSDDMASTDLCQYYPPIDLSHPRLRKLAKELGSVWVRVSGSWATGTYYDFDGHTGGTVPKGYRNVLTKDQWLGVLDFVRHVDGKLMVSLANCDGLHAAKEPWGPQQAELIFDLSKEYGVPIDAVEFTNEPNPMELCGLPKGYTASDYRRDQDLFCAWVRAHYPDTILVGPSTINGGRKMGPPGQMTEEAYALAVPGCSTDDLLEGTKEPLDIFSYHYYSGISERYASVVPELHWTPEQALSEAYLSTAPDCAELIRHQRDRFMPGAPMWVTEAGDACCGGSTWASTYLDVFRTLNELGGFAKVTDGIIFHNTLASSDYGFLKHGSFEPRPNYFAVLLWQRLMGTTVYDAGPAQEGCHIYAHSRKDGKEGTAYLVINNSETQSTKVELPCAADVYTLSAKSLRAATMQLNGNDLTLGAADALPALKPIAVPAGTWELKPATCTFLVL